MRYFCSELKYFRMSIPNWYSANVGKYVCNMLAAFGEMAYAITDFMNITFFHTTYSSYMFYKINKKHIFKMIKF